MLRLIVQTKRKYKKTTQPSRNDEEKEEEKANHRSSDEETVDGSSSNTDCDQDRNISFMKDTDEQIDTGETEEEDWIEYIYIYIYEKKHVYRSGKNENSKNPMLC